MLFSLMILFLVNNGISTAFPYQQLIPSDTGLTSAQKLYGFSGSYGLGGGLGSLTLNDIAYDLSRSFAEACRDVGIKLDLLEVKPLLPFTETLDKSETYLQLDALSIQKPVLNYGPLTDPLLNSQIIYSPIDKIGKYRNIDYKQIEQESYLTKLNNGYSLMSFSMGDRLSSKLTAENPFLTSKYSLQTADKKVSSGYSSHIIHTTDSSKQPIGESKVTFTQLSHHIDSRPSVKTIPEFDATKLDELSIVNHMGPHKHFTFEYPSEYKTALSKRYDMNGGFGSLLTGSYGSVLTNGYRTSQLITEGGLKGMTFLLTKK